jgi:hypothetical protein
MRALIIGLDEEAIIRRLVETAIAKPFELADLRAAMSVKGEALMRWKERLNEHTSDLPVGYLVTYTRERQPLGLCHHINVSVDAHGMLPHPIAVKMICEAFGMPAIRPGTANPAIVHTWVETYSNGRLARHIIALVEPL